MLQSKNAKDNGYKWQKDYVKRQEMSGRKCKIRGCDRPHSAKGFCAPHYQKDYLKDPKKRKAHNATMRAYFHDVLKKNPERYQEALDRSYEWHQDPANAERIKSYYKGAV